MAALIERVAARRDDDEDELKRALRRAKHEAALLIALADLGGVWDVVATTEALTRFADAAVGAAVRFLLRREARAGRLALDADAADIAAGCGFVVLALGKHGARELNYSSDIDLIALFDARSAAIPADVEPTPLFVRLVKALTRLLNERTADGYVFRVDLRLRPDPSATPVALSIASADRLLRDARPELGTRGDDQGAARRRRPRRSARASSPSSRRSSGASISTTRRSPTSTR